MSVTCPIGHVSATSDYCDQCGARIDLPTASPNEAYAAQAGEARAEASVEAQVTAEGPPDSGAIVTSTSSVAPPCPDCGASRAGGDRYCERCGYDFVDRRSGRAEPSTTNTLAWAALVIADREYFERNATEGVDFPDTAAPRMFVLGPSEVRIGRGRTSVDIDVAGAAQDPAISRLHAILMRQPDGSYSIIDQGSSNGTTINEDSAPIPAHLPVPLSDGDRVHVGAWTTIIVQRTDGSGPDQ
jgi:hypothetical protein